MPNSYRLHTANGSNTDFSLVGIDGWINSGFLKVYVNDALQSTGYSFQDLTTASPFVRFTTAPANGAIVKLQRETPTTVAGFQGNIVNFNDASVLTENDLDNMAKGLLHITQEAEDTGSGALGKTVDELNWNAASKRITALSSPTASTDAATKGYVDGVTLYGTGLATPQSWTLNGDASTTLFTLPSPVSASTDSSTFLVEIGGIIQRPVTDYTIPSTTSIQFASAPPSGSNNIRIRNFGAVRNIAQYNDSVTFGNNATVVGNLTVDTNTLFVDASNNRVGVGTVTPTQALDVSGNANISGNLVVDTNTLAVDAANNRVGIGTTTPAQALDVVGSINLTGNITGSTVGALASSLLPSGCVLQVIYGQTQTQVNLTSTPYTSTTLTASITPKRANSVILVFAFQHLYAASPSGGYQNIAWKIVRTVAATSADIGGYNYTPYIQGNSSVIYSIGNQCGVLRDTARPASTAEHTYTVFAAPSFAHNGTTHYAVANFGSTSSMVIVEVAA